MHSDAIWNNVLEVGTTEKLLKIRTLTGAFYRYRKRFFGSWNCAETFEIKDANWCILKLLIWCFRKLELLRNFKARLLNGAFCRNLKLCFKSWNCWENVENEVAYLCILPQFEIMFWKLELLRKLKINRLPNDAFCINLKRCKNTAPIYHYRIFGPHCHVQETFSCRIYILYYTYTINNGTQESGSFM